MTFNYFYRILFLMMLLFSVSGNAQQPGTDDSTFNVGDGPNAKVFSISVQPDNKIIIGGEFTAVSGATHRRFARLNTDGSLDTTFGNVVGPEAAVLTTAIQSDGKILIGGKFWTFNGVDRSHIVRLNPDGTFDNSFQMGIGTDDDVTAIIVQPNGKILVAGDFEQYNNIPVSGLIRLNSNGTLDSSFNVSVGGVRAITLQQDGKILIGGTFTQVNGSSKWRLARLNTNGTTDTSFVTPVQETLGRIHAIALQSNNKILVSCDNITQLDMEDKCLVRLNSNGSKDMSFAPIVNYDDDRIVKDILVQNDDKILICGTFLQLTDQESASFIARLNADGTVDNSFNTDSDPNAEMYSMGFQSNGKVIVGGNYTMISGVSRHFVTRYNTGTSLGFENSENISIFTIYPNPATDKFTIANQSDMIRSVSVFDVSGKNITTLSVNNYSAEVNTHSYAKGIYLVEIVTDTAVFDKKIIIK